MRCTALFIKVCGMCLLIISSTGHSNSLDAPTDHNEATAKKTRQHSQAVEKTNTIQGDAYIGIMAHTLTSSNILGDTASTYTGINFGIQFNVYRYLAIYSDINIGQFSQQKQNRRSGDSNTLSGSKLRDEEYISGQVALLLSSNLNTGWTFFSGAGAFTSRYISYSDSDIRAASGLNVQLGMGYRWQTLQLALRGHLLTSPAYSNTVTLSSVAQLQLGFRF